MPTFNIAEAKAHFSDLVNQALLGEDIIIARDHRALLRLVPLGPGEAPRVPGSARGEVLYVAADFDEVLDGFEDDL